MSASGFDAILGHTGAIELLRRCVEQDRVPHAMLFSGPYGVGKLATARALARALVCGDDAAEAERFDHGAHDRFVLYEDLAEPLVVSRRELLPIAGTEEALLTEYATLEAEGWIAGVSPRRGDRVADRLLRNPEKFTGRKSIPFAAVLEKELGALEKSRRSTPLTVVVARRLFSPGTSRAYYRRNLGIELINGKGDGAYFRTVDSLLSRAAGGGWRVAVLNDAHRMTEAAENAFLKTLEEPPPRTLLVLVTSEPMSLLSTTVSRCALVSFHALPADTVAAWLVDTQGFAPADAALLASLSEGSPGRALELGDTDFGARRRFVEALLPAVADGDLGRCLAGVGIHLGEAESAAVTDNARDAQRRQARWLLELLILCFRDLTLAASGAGATSRAGLDDARVAELAARRPAPDWERLFVRAEAALSDIDRSVEPRLALEAFLTDALPLPVES